MDTVVVRPVPGPAVTEEVEALLYVGSHYPLPLYVDVIRVLPGQTHPPQYRVTTETLNKKFNIRWKQKLKIWQIWYIWYEEMVNWHFPHYKRHCMASRLTNELDCMRHFWRCNVNTVWADNWTAEGAIKATNIFLWFLSVPHSFNGDIERYLWVVGEIT